MSRRLYFASFLLVYPIYSSADNNAWNCEKVRGGEWSCLPQQTEDDVSEKLETNESSELPLEPHYQVSPESEAVYPMYESEYQDYNTNSQPQPLADDYEPIASFQPRKSPVPVIQAERAKPGWNCKASEEDETWSCKLTGTDPKGQFKVIEKVESSSWLLTEAFDSSQEQTFDLLYSELKYDPWESCTSPSPGRTQFVPGKDFRNTAPMDVTADYSEVYDKEITSFFGNVEIVRADQKVSSDTASYDIVSETMDAQGQVLYSEDELSLFSDTALLNLATDEARLRNALFISPSSPIRGSADVVYRDSRVLSRYKDASFTSCPPGNQDWIVSAERLKMNKETGKGAAKNSWLTFKGLPLFYTPYIAFPLDDRRLSGLLTPTFGNSEDNGFDLLIPYYLNIAPNYDLTIWPRYLSKRGGMIGSEFRYLTEMTTGSVGVEVIPYDTLRQKPRYSASIRNLTQFNPEIKADIDLNYISDDEYFDELNNALGIETDRFLKSRADLSYRTEGISLITRMEAFQTIDRDISDNAKPYQKIPQVLLNLSHEFEEWPVELEMSSDYTNFYRNDRVSGHRINVKPSVSVPLKTAGTFLIPKVSLQHTEYFLDNQAQGLDDQISRTLPIMSVDSGLFLEKDLNLFDSSYRHTLEPRLFYLYIPEQGQSDIPDFDTALYDFNFSSLFRENRFSGGDRVQDANQFSLALTSRLIDSETGLERLKLSVGEIFYLQDREVTLTGGPETSTYSNFVAELKGQLTDELSFSSGLQWNHQASDVSRGDVTFRYRNQADQIINLGYRYRRDNPNRAATIIQTDASFRWPLFDNWYGVGRWQYSLRFNSTNESFLGLEKESCCWRFRLIWRRFADSVNDNSNNNTDEGVFVQFELKGLADFGDKVDEFLEKNLSGYERAVDK